MTISTASGQRMMDALPRFYSESRLLQGLFDSQGAELDALQNGPQDALNQYFVSTATWSLDLWEAEFGLAPNPALSTEERRSRVTGRMRGYGTVTIRLIKQIAESYQNGRVSVIPDYSASIMRIRFVDTGGAPANLSDLQAEIRRVLPAKYDLTFEFRYLRWSELDAKAQTWDQLDARAMTWDQFEVWL